MALIPARGGSKRLPRKNVLPLQNLPLIAWSIKAAQQCPEVDDVVVSTDDAEIAEVAREHGANVLDRPAELAGDLSPSLPVFQDALLRWQPLADVLLVLQPTTPFRKVADMSGAIQKLLDEQASAVLGVSKAKMGPEWMLELVDGSLRRPDLGAFDRSRSQDQLQRFWINGALYVYTRQNVLDSEKYAWGDKVLPWPLQKPYDLDIDDLEDFRIAKAIAHEFDLHS